MVKFKFSFKYLALTAIALLCTMSLFSQQKYRIQIISSEAMLSDERNPDAIKIIGNPIFEHDGAYLYCDSALMYEKTNSIDCFGKVHIKSGDTLHMYGRFLKYNGNTRIANIKDSVKVRDPNSTLYSNEIVYNRNTNIVSYFNGGRIVNKDNTLKSKKADYHTDTKLAYFSDDVIMFNSDYTVNTDTLKYNTETRIAYFLGPTQMVGEDVFIYCEDGEYDREKNNSRFSKRAKLIDGTRILTGDSLCYYENQNYGKAKGNIFLTDTLENIIVRGNFAEYFKSLQFAYITKKPHAEIWENSDTLFLRADTLRVTFDTVSNDTKDIFAYYNTKFYRSDIQGACDSMVYATADSVVCLMQKPVLWSDENQITADTIYVFLKNEQIDNIKMCNSAFIISQDTLYGFNQLKGKNMIAYFKDQQLNHIDITGNAESLYYVKENDNTLIGINIMKSNTMTVVVSDNKVSQIHNYQTPDAKLYPEDKLTEENKYFKNFLWRSSDRPLNKEHLLGTHQENKNSNQE